jgi:hypothetical protein
MKKFWIVLLALGLVAGFAMSASAADVKFSGSYYLAGIYADNNGLTDKALGTAQADYYQRLRVQTEFKIAEGLSLVTRFDALEKKWGSGTTTTDWRASNSYDVTNRSSLGVATNKVQENIEFERAYLDFNTKIGKFNIGYQNFVAWGTMFMDTWITRPGIKYFVPVGPLTIVAAIEKTVDRNTGAGTQSDGDVDIYDLAAVYKFGAGDAGLLYQYQNSRLGRNATAASYTTKMNAITPYVKMKFGPVYVEAEGIYGFGDWIKYDGAVPAGATNVSAEAMALYLNAKADFGPAYVGGMFIYIRGDDWGTTDKVEGGLAAALLAGDAFNPCLMLWSGEYTTWVGNFAGNATGANAYTASSNGITTYMDNVWFYQIYGGFKPTKESDIMLSVTYAYADKKPRAAFGPVTAGNPEFVSDVYGTEVDLVAKYKIFDNLEYMIGGAYLFTGDYFKGTNSAYKIENNYLLTHKLTLTF